MRKLEGDDPVRLEYGRDAADEVENVGDVCQDVIADQEVGSVPRRRQFRSQRLAEEAGH